MKKPKEKTYWVAKSAKGTIDATLYKTKRSAIVSNRLIWEDLKDHGWKIVKVKLVEVSGNG